MRTGVTTRSLPARSLLNHIMAMILCPIRVVLPSHVFSVFGHKHARHHVYNRVVTAER